MTTRTPYGPLERTLIVIHRWVGIFLALLMLLWTLSGIVMLYVAFPELTDREIAGGSQPLNLAGCCVASAGAALDGYDSITVSMMAGRPVARVNDAFGRRQTFDLTNGKWLQVVPEQLASDVASSHLAQRNKPGEIVSLSSIHNDQWTVYQRFHPHRPLFKVAFDSPDGDVLYVSGTTAEVVQDTDARERFWNWLGAVPHWLYYTSFRQHQRLWYEVVVWASVLGTLLTVSGLYLGIKRTLAAGGRWTRYLGAMRWHHLTGLVFGVATLTWVLSGLLSMNPWGWLESHGGEEIQRLAGPSPDAGRINLLLDRARGGLGAETVSLSLSARTGTLAVTAVDSGGSSQRLDFDTLQPHDATSREITASLSIMRPDAQIASIDLLHDDDAYYFGHKSGIRLPVYRAILDDAERTHYYFDAATGEMIQRVDRAAKLYRWLHYGLHRLDFTSSLRSRPLWDALMLVLLVGVSLLCAVGCWVGYRHLRYR